MPIWITAVPSLFFGQSKLRDLANREEYVAVCSGLFCDIVLLTGTWPISRLGLSAPDFWDLSG